MAKTVLVIEDDPVGRQAVSTAIRKAGFETVTAADAVIGLGMVTRHKPKAIILDLGLPGGGGLQLLERLSHLPALSTVPVIVVSGQARATHEPQALAAGASLYFEKPVTPEAIVAAVREAIGDA